MGLAKGLGISVCILTLVGLLGYAAYLYRSTSATDSSADTTTITTSPTAGSTSAAATSSGTTVGATTASTASTTALPSASASTNGAASSSTTPTTATATTSLPTTAVATTATNPTSTAAAAPKCNTAACNGVISSYLSKNWAYTTSDFGECANCPVVKYPNKLPS